MKIEVLQKEMVAAMKARDIFLGVAIFTFERRCTYGYTFNIGKKPC